MKFLLIKLQQLKALHLLLLLIILTLAISCTKYTTAANTTTSTTGTSTGGTGYTPLPPVGGTGTGGTGTGGSGTGTGSGGTGTGGSGSGTSNIPQSYVQGFIFTSLTGSYVTVNDSISLLQNGFYTPVFAGSNLFKSKVGTGAASDIVYTTASYFLRPYSFYSYVLFKSPAATVGETMLFNDQTVPAFGTAQVRFISLDPLTTAAPITFKLTNYLDVLTVPNRTYLDNRTDSNFNSFRTITPGFSNVSFIYKDTTTLSFSQNFEAGKKYTVFAGALNYTTSNKGTLPINYYQIARHN